MLQNVLPDHLWWHFSLLVGAISIYLGTNITREQQKHAEIMIDKYCRLYENFYGTFYVYDHNAPLTQTNHAVDDT